MTTVIVLAHNGWYYTEQCLDSIRRDSEVPILVVDNASTDDTKKELRKRKDKNTVHYPMTENLGWSGGNNAGMERAFQRKDCDAVVLLNNDIIVTAGWLAGIQEVSRRNDAGIVGPMLSMCKGKQELRFKPEQENGFEQLEKFALDIAENPIHKNEIPMLCQRDGIKYPFLSGAALFIKREVYERVGELDTDLVYWEDDLYCLKADRAGFTLRIAPRVWLYHFGAKTYEGVRFQSSKALMDENKQKFLEKCRNENPDD